ncbi:MAG: cytochrome P450 [Zymomonas sp.]|nr:MAG: cytochrome P450 [Zymomonas sp.]
MQPTPSPNVSNLPDNVDPSQVFDFDIYHDEGLLEDLHLGYRALQLKAPEIFWTPRNGGHWMVTRNELVQRILKDPANFSNAEIEIPKTQSPHKQIPINLDPPEHTPYRNMLMRHFMPRVVAGLDESMQRWSRTVIDRAYAAGHCEFTEDLGAAFPVFVFMEMVGLPFDRFAYFRDIVTEFFSHISKERRIELQETIYAEIDAIVTERRAEPRDDLFTKLLAEEVNGRKLTDAELRSIGFLLFAAGLDTVANMMSFMFHFLAKRPDLQTLLREDAGMIAPFVDETLRRFPITNGVRLIVNDIEFAGAQLKAGEMIVAPMSVANLDDRKYPNPETFDINRAKKDHITFSVGPHLCLGHYLARAEMRMFLAEFLGRIPRFSLPEGFKPQYRAGVVMALENLELEWEVEREPALA